jgi:tetratricopeptide (TPR) repeat protein
MNRQQRRAAARNSGQVFSGGSASTPDALYESGRHHLLANQRDEAERCCRQALKLKADHADSLHLMGQICIHSRQYDWAVDWVANAIRQEPKIEYLTTLGVALQFLERFEEALKAFDKAVQLQPERAELWRNRGNVLIQLERHSDAVLAYQHALKLDPSLWDAAYRNGVLLQWLGRHDEAVAALNACDSLKPNHALTLRLRAVALSGLKRFKEAFADGERAHKLDPINAETCHTIGEALQGLDRHEDALSWFERALEVQPALTKTLSKKAFSLMQLLRVDDAMTVYDRLKTINPDDVENDWNLAYVQMLTGDFEAGWTGRESRWKMKSIKTELAEFSKPMWLGEESIDGKTILVHTDEGLGDSLQFVRYVPLLAERGARVILAVDDPIHALCTGLAGVSECLVKSKIDSPMAVDFHCATSSLPLAFATRLETIPSKPYLPQPEEIRRKTWQDRLGAHDRLRVGVVWSGNQKHLNDHNRSIPLRTFTRIFGIDADLISLQKDMRVDDRDILLAEDRVRDLSEHLNDFAETAALISCLDLVISVDTSVAHLAGGMGCPVWILLPYSPDYRWLLDREDSPWYPTARLFRQSKARDWDGVLARVRDELQVMVAMRA